MAYLRHIKKKQNAPFEIILVWITWTLINVVTYTISISWVIKGFSLVNIVLGLIVACILSYRKGYKDEKKHFISKANKNQRLIFLFTILLLLILPPLSRPRIFWAFPETDKQWEEIEKEEQRLDRISFIYLPFAIFSVGTGLIYIFRDKEK